MPKQILAALLPKPEIVKEARFHYERALKLNPNHELARENLQQLNQDNQTIITTNGASHKWDTLGTFRRNLQN